MELDQTLGSRDMINERMREVIEDASVGWGVDMTRVELQAIEPPRDMQQSMELAMRAERERRAAVTNAEAGKRAAILEAEGQREAQVRKAEGEKEAAILRAEGRRETQRRSDIEEFDPTTLPTARSGMPFMRREYAYGELWQRCADRDHGEADYYR